MQEGKTAEQNYKKDQGNNAQFGKDEMAAFKGVRCAFLFQAAISMLLLSALIVMLRVWSCSPATPLPSKISDMDTSRSLWKLQAQL